VSKKLYLLDDEFRQQGARLLAGVDEAGRGPWAGPVVAAAVILKPGVVFKGLNDSKKVLPETRERLYEQIVRESLFHSVAVVEAALIDELNILQATLTAMRRALFQLGAQPDLILVDGNRKIPECRSPQLTIIQGDGKSACVAAASILAKVTRDRWMVEAHKRYPHYDFDRNKGYGTPTHQEALKKHGPCDIHRRTYSPVINAASPLLPFPELEPVSN
jgi:ribonuclease HII